MDTNRFTTLEIQDQSADQSVQVEHERATTFDPSTLLRRYVELRSLEKKIEEEKKDITATLLGIMDETGELVSDGFFTMVPRERVTVTVDADALKESNPKLYAKCLGFDKKIADGLIKAKVIKADDLEPFTTRKVSRYIDVKGEKE